MSPDVARQALIATHGGLSLEWCATVFHISTMSLYRLICAFGHHSAVTVLTRCGLPLPTSILADEQHSRCLTERVYLPTMESAKLWGDSGMLGGEYRIGGTQYRVVVGACKQRHFSANDHCKQESLSANAHCEWTNA